MRSGTRTEVDVPSFVHAPPVTLTDRTPFVASAEGLRFAADVGVTPHPYMPFSSPVPGGQPSVLLLTQNIGGIDAADGITAPAVANPAGSPNSTGGDGITPLGGLHGEAAGGATAGGGGNSARSTASSANSSTPTAQTHGLYSAVPPSALNPAHRSSESSDFSGSSFAFSADEDTVPLSETTKAAVHAFVADLRRWIHRMAVLYMQRGKQTQPGGLAAYSTDMTPPQLDVVVIHFQEIGGKCLHRGFNELLGEVLAHVLLPEAGWCSGLMMDRDNRFDRFTAMGSIVFLSPRMRAISSVLSFPHQAYIPVEDDPCSYGGTSDKLFHRGKFHSAGRSRKGYLLLSLRLGTTVFNTCNVHLFNDDDNSVAIASAPSKYVKKRMDAFLEAAAECLTMVPKDEPLFFFGDFNTRLDCCGLAEYVRDNQGVYLRAARKSLRVPDSFWTLFRDPASFGVLRDRFDKEPRTLMDFIAEQSEMELAEMPVVFAPTYSRIARKAPYSLHVSSTSSDTCVEAAGEGCGGPADEEGEEADGGSHRVPARHPSLQHGASSTDPLHTGSLSGVEERDDEEAHHHVSTAAPVKAATTTTTTAAVPTTEVGLLTAPGSFFADPARDFAHERIPAWCDRVLFNPAGLELMAGGRAVQPQGLITLTSPTTAALHSAATDEENSSNSGASSFVQTSGVHSTIQFGSVGANTTAASVTVSGSASASSYAPANAGAESREDAAAWSRLGQSLHEKMYLYDAVSLVHTDHDGVFLMF